MDKIFGGAQGQQDMERLEAIRIELGIQAETVLEKPTKAESVGLKEVEHS